MLLLCAAGCARAALTDAEVIGLVEHEAKASVECFVTGDFRRLAEHTLPQVVQGMGGVEAMARRLEQGMAAGPRVTGVEVRPATIHRRASTIYAVVPFTLEVTTLGILPSQRDSYLLGVSTDGGRGWHFVDGSGLTRDTLRRVLPEFPPDIPLPERN